MDARYLALAREALVEVDAALRAAAERAGRMALRR